MYKLLLILRYLRRKLAPLFAMLAVMLCSAMVIVVGAVMGGFLEQFAQAARQVNGDVTVQAGMHGFPHYDRVIETIETLPEASAAAATLTAYGLVKIEDQTHTIEVMGIDPASFHAVSGYRDSLYWTTRHLTEQLDEEIELLPAGMDDLRQRLEEGRGRLEASDFRDYAMRFEAPSGWRAQQEDPTLELPAAVLGIEVYGYGRRDEHGRYHFSASPLRSPYSRQITLTVLPVSRQGTFQEPMVRQAIVVNESKSGLYNIDSNRVYVPFAVLQAMLRMDAYERVDPRTSEPTGVWAPARAHRIMVRAAPGVSAAILQQAVEAALSDLRGELPDLGYVDVLTWQQSFAVMLSAVAKEKAMVMFLFGIVSVVAFTMIAVIFYMIVLEKTRDIGILRALGASRRGVAGIFLGYGLAIGLIGAALGLAIASQIVWNINEIQAFLARTIGFEMWNPQVYYFDAIPSRLDSVEVTWILTVAVVCSVLGALIPAFAAARLNPVEALRYE